MQRRAFLPTLLTGAAVAAVAPRVIAAAADAPAKTQPTRPARRRRGLMHNPKFEQLSFDGKRLIEYSRPFLNKLPRPGPGIVSRWLLAHDELMAEQRADLRQMLVYVEYMSKPELRRYLDAPADGRMEWAALEAGLKRLAAEARIPFHTGAKVVVLAFGPWDDRTLRTAPPDPALLPHAARELMSAGTWYPRVTGAPTTLAAFTRRVVQGGSALAGGPASVTALIRDGGLPRESVWTVAGEGSNATALGDGAAAPYLLTTADAQTVDTYLRGTGIGKMMREAKTPEARRALRKELLAVRDQAMEDLHLTERYPHAGALRFLGQVLFRERGIKDRGNTFVHVGGLRAMQLVHPKFLYVQFGVPDAALRKRKGGRAFGEQGTVGQGQYTDADYLMDLDQWSYYHWLEAQRHPHYAGESTFVLLFGPQPGGTTQAIVTGPGARGGKRHGAAVALPTLLRRAVDVLV